MCSGLIRVAIVVDSAITIVEFRRRGEKLLII
jgi:hypothetical protein